VVPAMVVGLGVQIQTDDGQRSGSESCQSIDLFGEQIGHDVKTALCVKHEKDQVRLGGSVGRNRAECTREEMQKLHLKCGTCWSIARTT